MCALVARTGRQRQRYQDGCRLVAGCIPFRNKTSDGSSDGSAQKTVEVLMINSMNGHGLLFPKGGWETDETKEEAAAREAVEEAGVRGDLMGFLGYYDFKGKTLQEECCREGHCKSAMFALLVKEELASWPEQSTHERFWLRIPEAAESCRYPWLREALIDGFVKWHQDNEHGVREGDLGDVYLESSSSTRTGFRTL